MAAVGVFVCSEAVGGIDGEEQEMFSDLHVLSSGLRPLRDGSVWFRGHFETSRQF